MKSLDHKLIKFYNTNHIFVFIDTLNKLKVMVTYKILQQNMYIILNMYRYYNIILH